MDSIMEQIFSNYAVLIYDDVILSDNEMSIMPIDSELIKDVVITFINDKTICIEGNKVCFEFSFDGGFIDNPEIIEDKNLLIKFNIFKWKKQPYLKSGWYRLKETSKFKRIKSNFEITFN